MSILKKVSYILFLCLFLNKSDSMEIYDFQSKNHIKNTAAYKYLYSSLEEQFMGLKSLVDRWNFVYHPGIMYSYGIQALNWAGFDLPTIEDFCLYGHTNLTTQSNIPAPKDNKQAKLNTFTFILAQSWYYDWPNVQKSTRFSGTQTNEEKFAKLKNEDDFGLSELIRSGGDLSFLFEKDAKCSRGYDLLDIVFHYGNIAQVKHVLKEAKKRLNEQELEDFLYNNNDRSWKAGWFVRRISNTTINENYSLASVQLLIDAFKQLGINHTRLIYQPEDKYEDMLSRITNLETLQYLLNQLPLEQRALAIKQRKKSIWSYVQDNYANIFKSFSTHMNFLEHEEDAIKLQDAILPHKKRYKEFAHFLDSF